MRHNRTALAVAALAIGASMQLSGVASAAPTDNPRGTCNLGGQSFFRAESGGGAFGCAGNVGGFVIKRTGDCVQVNQGPFDEFECDFTD
jgi:hypothetical protein